MPELSVHEAAELHRKLEAIIATEQFTLTGPMVLQLVSVLMSTRSALAAHELHNRRQRSLSSSTRGYTPPDTLAQIDKLETAIDDLVDIFAKASKPTRAIDE